MNANHQRLDTYFILFLGVSLALALNGCATERISLQQGQSPSQAQVYEGITVELTYVDEETLKNRHGKENNPFIAPDTMLNLYKFLVFEINARYESGTEAAENAPPIPLTLLLNRAELQFGGKAWKPTNRFHLSNFWELRIEKQGTYERWNKGRVNNTLNKTVVDNETNMRPDAPLEGEYIVFIGSFPTYGDASVYLPLSVKENQMFHNFIFTFKF